MGVFEKCIECIRYQILSIVCTLYIIPTRFSNFSSSLIIERNKKKLIKLLHIYFGHNQYF